MQASIVFLIFGVILAQGAPAVRDDEQDVFDLWVKETSEDLDKNFEEFMKVMESSQPDETASRAIMSQNTVDRFQELVASMRKDTTDEFWKFMKGMQTEMEGSFEGFMRTVEKEMDANFDDFMKNMMGTGDTRTAFESEYQQWKTEEINQAHQRFLEYSKTQNRDERDTKNLVNIFANRQGAATKVANFPVKNKRDIEQPLQTDGSSRANQNPASSVIPNPQQITGAIPSPVKDVIPGMANSAETPTLFIGGFSILMMPMPNGVGNVQQMMMQSAPNMLSMVAPTG